MEEAAGKLGVFEVDEGFRVRSFIEKPENPKTVPGDDEHTLASMGIYIFKTDFLMKVLEKDGGKLAIDIPRRHGGLLASLRDAGFQERGSLVRMLKRSPEPATDLERMFATAGAAFG